MVFKKFSFKRMENKKNIFVSILFIRFLCIAQADDLADILQDLAVQIACIGMYSTAQTGVYVTSRYDDPPDWYTPPMMANRFAAMSGNMTRTDTFYGVCFDYAQFAYNDIRDNQRLYNNKGMKQWYIAVTSINDPYTIILYDPVSKDKATITMNGVYLKENSRHKVYAHDGATGHAWLWVQHNNGTWYWIDPTWTDNTGWVWWGKVENGREERYYPDPVYCVASNYPRPSIANNSPQNRPSSPSQSSSPSQPSPSYSPPNYTNDNRYMISMLGYNYVPDIPTGLTIGIFGFYVSLNWADNEVTSSDSESYVKKTKTDYEYTAGYSFYLLNKYLRLPIGIGMRWYSEGYNIVGEDYKFVIEAGLQLILLDYLYFSGTYRLIGFEKHSFSLGAGIIFCGY